MRVSSHPTLRYAHGDPVLCLIEGNAGSSTAQFAPDDNFIEHSRSSERADAMQQLIIDRQRGVILVDGCEQALGHAFGFAHEDVCHFRRKNFGGGLFPESEPAIEVTLADARQHEVSHHGVAFVTSAGKHERRPEIAHGLEVRPPLVAYCLSKNGTENLIFAHTSVEAIDEDADGFFADLLRRGKRYKHAYKIIFRGQRMKYFSLSGEYGTAMVKGMAVKCFFLFCILMLSNIAAQGQERLIWSDEFNAAGVPDPTNWTYDAGSDGWGNHELETYCSYKSSQAPCDASLPNAFVGNDGYLHIVARKDARGRYTSARLKSEGLKSFQYGRIEARIRIPEGQGFWPAFWMLGDNEKTVQWPACGEFDIMENIGKEPGTVHGSIHGTGFTGEKIGLPYALPGTKKFGDGFHVFGLIWSPKKVQYYVDDPAHVYASFTPADLPKGAVWPFDDGKYFFLLNLAIGGDWPGNPDAASRFPQEMLVDYVRVYAASAK